MSDSQDPRRLDRLFGGWAELTAGARPPGLRLPPRRTAEVPVVLIGAALIVMTAVLALGRLPTATPPGGAGASGSSGGTVVETSPSSSPASTAPALAGSPSESASPERSTEYALDRETARSIAEQYETARADGNWQAAWALLAPYSRQSIGQISDFIAAQTAYNDAGGAVFEIAEPTQDPDLLNAQFLGEPYRDVERNAVVARAYLVFINHPNVRGASAASTALVVAPADGKWMVWIAR